MAKTEAERPDDAAVEAAPDERNKYLLLDMMDEAAFLEEQAGAVVDTYVYEVEQWDPKLRQKVKRHQLSKAGVDAACMALADQHVYVRELEITHQIDRQAEEAFFQVKVGRFRRTEEGEEVLLDVAHGVKRQEMVYTIAGGANAGKRIPNPHWYEHGVMKAARNARKRMLREDLVVKLIAGWVKEPKRVQTVDMTTSKTRREAAAATVPARKEAEQRAVAEEARTAPTSTGDEPKTRAQILERIARELDEHFGEGEPSRVPRKDKVLRTIFMTSDWASLERMPEARFFKLWDYSRFCDAVVLATEEA